jgi:hypothetical protein
MLWFIQNIAFSISLIVIIHYLYLYFESTLTTPKVKDLIHCPKQKYHSLFETINKKLNEQKNGNNKPPDTPSYTKSGEPEHLGILPKNSNNNTDTTGNEENGIMKTDLKKFLRSIGLKRQSNSMLSNPPLSAYEMN